jgi:DNA-binding winged helix-turn-helix (wHTH) protein/tetratricopeptide (TPR) repeat protein
MKGFTSASPDPPAADPGRGDGLPGFPATGLGRGSDEQGFSFASFRLEADGTLLRGETLVHLPPKELAALRLLLAHAGQTVSPLQLRQALWGDIHVTADSVPKCLSSLRARLEPDECIQTVYKRGYRLAAAVRPLGAPPPGALPRLAIVPFATGYSVPEHLGWVVAEETIARLVNLFPPLVAVLARDSVFALALQGRTAQQVGETLKADLVLTGTLSAMHAQFRLRTEMIRIADGAQIWVDDLLVAAGRIAGVESDLVERLAFRLGIEAPAVPNLLDAAGAAAIGGEEPSPLPGRAAVKSISAAAEPAGDPNRASRRREAYETFLRGHYEWQTMQRHRMQDGLQHLLRATELDPSLLPARVDLVNLCVTQTFYGFMPASIAAGHVRDSAESLPEIALRAPAILPAVGWIGFHVDRDLPAALQAFSLSSHLPHDPWTTRLRVMLALSRHRFPQAIAILRAAIDQDPYSPWLQARMGWAFHLSGQAAESVDQAERTLSLFPDHPGANLYGSMILAFNGNGARATALAGELARRLPYFDLATSVHAYALACEGRAEEARTILERLQWLSRERFVLNSFTPAVYVALGDLDTALAELRVSDQARCPWFFQLLADPRLKPLHGRPEFDAMLALLSRMEADAAQDPGLDF